MCEAVGKGTCAPRPHALESLNVSFAKCHKKDYTPGRPDTLGRHACIDFGDWSRNERDQRKLALTEEVAVEYIHQKVTYSAMSRRVELILGRPRFFKTQYKGHV